MKLFNWLRRTLKGAGDPHNFGNTAIDLGYVTSDQVKEAIQHQKQRVPIGEIMVILGYMSEWERDQVLIEQDMRRAVSSAEKASIELRRQGLIIDQLKRSLKDITDATTTFITAVDCNGKSLKEMATTDTDDVPVLPMVASAKK